MFYNSFHVNFFSFFAYFISSGICFAFFPILSDFIKEVVSVKPVWNVDSDTIIGQTKYEKNQDERTCKILCRETKVIQKEPILQRFETYLKRNVNLMLENINQ